MKQIIQKKKIRESNIELFRIVLMLLIIAHHYVVNSGLSQMYEIGNLTPNTLFLQILGGGG